MIFRNIESLELRNGPLLEGEEPFNGGRYNRFGDGIIEVVDVRDGRAVGP